MSFAVRVSLLTLVVVLPTLLAACGPVRSTIVLIQADTALREARALGSAETAPYPTEMSSRLIEKAKEEQGYSSYDTATVLAEDARMLARDALRLAKEAAPAEEEAAPAEEEAAPAEEEAAPAGEEAAPAGELDVAEEPATESPTGETTGDPADQPPATDGEAAP
jgi:hypothetical protein